MFEKARLQLTAWYLLIIVVISILFSITIYHVSTQEIERAINRLEYRRQFPNRPMPDWVLSPQDLIDAAVLEELREVKRQIFLMLATVNTGIFLIAGIGSYFLAGRTLNPIKQMVDEQNQFVSDASHELRTPIATLRAEMEASLLEKHISESGARQLISSNLEELGVLQQLTDKLLHTGKAHTFSANGQMKKLALRSILQQAQKKLLSLAHKKKIVLEDKVRDAFVAGDQQKLTEVFVILLDNAIKYSNQKTTVTISSKIIGKKVIVSITDQGIGISRKEQYHIFDRFYRADLSRSQTEGFGLGLAIAQQIVQSHNGLIRVKSSLAKGSTFLVELPQEN
jgi:two-component system, OmpR family, sensor histidine kinase CiaH